MPKENKAIGCKLVYANKEGFPHKNEIWYKARLISKSYVQKEGIDYNGVLSPNVKHLSIQILLTMVAQFNLELVQRDVKIVSLHGDFEEEMYMTQPNRFKITRKENLGLQIDKVALWIETISEVKNCWKVNTEANFVEHLHMVRNFWLHLHVLPWNFLLFNKVSTKAIKIERWPRFFSKYS